MIIFFEVCTSEREMIGKKSKKALQGTTHQATQDAAHFDLDTMLCPESRLESLWSEQKVKGRLWRDSMLESLWSEQKVKCGWPAAVKHATQSE